MEIDPTDSKAEFVLTKAWIGLGSQEKKKGNYRSAKGYFKKAVAKWPLNSELHKELADLEAKHPDSRASLSLGSEKFKLEQETLGTLNAIRTDLILLTEEFRMRSINMEVKFYFYWLFILMSVIILELGILIRKR